MWWCDRVRVGAEAARVAARWGAVAVIVVAAAGCGFHLRGSSDLPEHLSPVRIVTSNVSSELVTVLTDSLERGGTEVVDSREAARLTLSLSNDRSERRVLSVGGGGKVREYELLYEVNYRAQLTGADGPADAGRVRVVRDYEFDQTEVLGKASEQEELERAMRQDAAAKIIRRLEAMGRQTAPGAAQ